MQDLGARVDLSIRDGELVCHQHVCNVFMRMNQKEADTICGSLSLQDLSRLSAH